MRLKATSKRERLFDNPEYLFYIPQALRKKERDYEHEMERLAREKIASQQKLVALKKEFSAGWDHVDFNNIVPGSSAGGDVMVVRNGKNFSEQLYKRNVLLQVL